MNTKKGKSVNVALGINHNGSREEKEGVAVKFGNANVTKTVSYKKEVSGDGEGIEKKVRRE